METKHTKGEWKITQDKYNIYIGVSHTNACRIEMPRWSTDIKEQAKLKSHPDNLEAEANAKLIKTAPVLLKACIEAVKHHQGGHSEIGHILKEAIKEATE